MTKHVMKSEALVALADLLRKHCQSEEAGDSSTAIGAFGSLDAHPVRKPR